MKRLLLLSIILLTACVPSPEEKKNIAATTCSIIGATRNMDSAVRVREMNDARDRIGGKPFVDGDFVIRESINYGLCSSLVLEDSYYEKLRESKRFEWEIEESARERRAEEERIAAEKQAEERRIAAEKQAEERRIAAEKQRIADSKPTIKEEFWDSYDGILKSRTNFQPKSEGGKKHGLEEKFRTSGKLKERVNYKNGKKDGLEEKFTTSGQLKERVNYKNGEYDGLYELYYESSDKLKTKIHYKNGKKDGLKETYFSSGNLASKSNWKDGKEDGRSLLYHFNGSGDEDIRSETNYKDGKKDGLHRTSTTYSYGRDYTYCYKNDKGADMSYCEK